MKIISNFKDYYDIGLKYGIDPEVIFKRTNQEYKIVDSLKYNKLDATQIDLKLIKDFFIPLVDYKSMLINPFYIGFCGKLYLGFSYTIKTFYEQKEIFFYSKEDYCNMMTNNDLTYNKDKENFYSKFDQQFDFFNRIIITNTNIDEIFNKYSVREIGHDLFRKFNSPIFLLKHYYYKHEMKIIVNPILRMYKFMKKIDPMNAFQEINMYISCILGKEEKEIVTIPDNIQLYKKGFDKYSFKKEKKI